MLPAALGLLVGVLVGAFGGGGGVVTVPVLVYVLGQSAQDATTSSAIIVGVTSAAGAVVRARAGTVAWRTGLAFATVGVPAAYGGTLLNLRVPGSVLLLTLAGLTVLAGAAMLVDSRRSGRVARPKSRRRIVTAAKVIGCGAVVGFLTGFLGVGGGFLVVPALVVVMDVPMRYAIGTSLLVIAVNSTAALAARTGGPAPDWALVVPFTAAAVAGTVVGKRISDRFSGRTLTRGFAVLLIVIGVAVVVEVLLGG